MRKLCGLLLTLLIIVTLGYAVAGDSGYVLISYRHWSIETSLWLLLLAWLLSLACLLALINLTHAGKQLLQSVTQALDRARAHKRNRLFDLAICQLISGKWAAALDNFSQTRQTPGFEFAATLGAGIAAHHLKQPYRDYLPPSSNKAAVLASLLVHTHLHWQQQQWHDVASNLTQLQQLAPQDAQVLRFQARLYQHQEDWHKLLNLLTRLRRQRLFPAAQLQQLELQARRALLQQATATGNLGSVKKLFSKACTSQQTELLHDYLAALISLQQGDLAAATIEQKSRRELSTTLLDYYAQAMQSSQQLTKRVKFIQKKLKDTPNSAQLLLILGELALLQKNYKEANTLLSKSLTLTNSPAAHHALAQTLEKTGNIAAALDHYQQAQHPSSLAP